MSSGDNKAHISAKGSSALAGIGTNPTGDEPNKHIAHVDKGSSALDGVGAIPIDTQKQEQLSQPQPKNATEYVTGALSNAYTTVKDTIGNLGTNQTTTDKTKSDK
ncbi:12552_t:CDS:2 [Funneliformis geosporum]|uniref:2228_t:CDS:1 n=1 Tax=Funneliformis geosporum TaxID=1117311 RepID=A0A9W4T6C1_9GLOM|nr:12552_t:CDS:2 [Funneliformis geosporum]CAI2193450.1 2228_t:CDS:2 [Funneliformis geosporum]